MESTAGPTHVERNSLDDDDDDDKFKFKFDDDDERERERAEKAETQMPPARALTTPEPLLPHECPLSRHGAEKHALATSVATSTTPPASCATRCPL